MRRIRIYYATADQLMQATKIELRLWARIIAAGQSMMLNDLFGARNEQTHRWFDRVMRLLLFYGEWQYQRGRRDEREGMPYEYEE
jgi:hypothetical protein